MEYYSAFSKEGILTNTTTGMNLENIMLSKINQTIKNIVGFHLLYIGSYNSQINRDRK